MVALRFRVLVLLLSLASMLAIVAYELYKGGNKLGILGGILAYLGLLPGFVDRAFGIPDEVMLPILVLGLCSMLVGLGLLWKYR